MFGLFWFSMKVLHALKSEFDYEPSVPGCQHEPFNQITGEAKAQRHNEFDAAMMFMLVQLNVLAQGRKAAGQSTDTERFFEDKVRRALHLLPKCTDPIGAFRLLQHVRHEYESESGGQAEDDVREKVLKAAGST
jgi:hypothetical protein